MVISSLHLLLLHRPHLKRTYTSSTRTSSVSSIESAQINNPTNPSTFEIKQAWSKKLSIQQLISEDQWHAVITLLHSKCRVAKKRYVVPSFLNEWKGPVELLPIHQACSRPSVPVKVIETLLTAYPAAIHTTESGMKRNPLAIAVRSGASDEVISFLLEKYPQAAGEQDSHDRIPLHYACSNRRSGGIIRQLINQYPQSIRAPDKKGWTPLHVSVTKFMDPEIIRLMVSICPEALSMKTNTGHTALTLANLSTEDIHDDIEGILSQVGDEFEKLPTFANYRDAMVQPSPIEMCLV